MKWKCPECGGSLTDTDVLAGHCKWCGQAIYGLEPPNGTIIYHIICHWCYIQGGTDRPPIKEKNESVDTFKIFSGIEDLKLEEKTVSRE